MLLTGLPEGTLLEEQSKDSSSHFSDGKTEVPPSSEAQTLGLNLGLSAPGQCCFSGTTKHGRAIGGVSGDRG